MEIMFGLLKKQFKKMNKNNQINLQPFKKKNKIIIN